MNIVCKVFGEDEVLAEKIPSARLVKGGIIIEMVFDYNSKAFTFGSLSEEIKDIIFRERFEFFVNATENGGGMTNTGTSQIVCGMDGGKLTPFFVPRGGHRACMDHAHFSVRGEFVTVHGNKRTGEVMIFSHKIENHENGKILLKKEIWSGFLSELPECFNCYAEPVKAAHAKARCYHCKCIHYANEIKGKN